MILPHKPFYFIRHGETDLNKSNIIMGSIDSPLNEQGFQQAQDAAEILAAEKFDVVISSPRLRAQQTAEAIAHQAKQTIQLDHGLAERVWGEAEGKPVDPTKSIFDDNYTPQGAETFADFQQRVITALSAILKQEQLPLIVSHGGVLKALTKYLGSPDIASSNCVPFIFKPPLEPMQPWVVCALSEED